MTREKRDQERRGPHHIIPTSRGGEKHSGENIYPDERWPPEEQQHIYWHILFSNMRPEEVSKKIGEYMDNKGALNEKFFATAFSVGKPWKNPNVTPAIKEKTNPAKILKRKSAWQIVFPGMNGREAIEWIEREFIRKEWLRTKNP